MPAPRNLDPSESPLALFASELRRFRHIAGLSQLELAVRLNSAKSLLGMVETGRRVPTRRFAERCDQLLNAHGVLAHLWPLVDRHGYSNNLPPVAELESAAAAIHSYQSHVVDPLLQTKDYAQAALALELGADHPELDRLLHDRLERQRILDREIPPYLSLLLDGAVLHHVVGDPGVMRDQLAHLIRKSQHPRITLRMLPLDAPIRVALRGPLRLLTLPDGSDHTHTPTYDPCRPDTLTTTHTSVLHTRTTYDRATAHALTPDATRHHLSDRLGRT